MKGFVGLGPKMYSYCAVDDCVDQEIQKDYKKCLESNKTILRSEQRFRSEFHAFTEKINTKPTIICSKLIIETLEQGVKYVQS